jgi:hypothetical protein
MTQIVKENNASRPGKAPCKNQALGRRQLVKRGLAVAGALSLGWGVRDRAAAALTEPRSIRTIP